MSIIRSYNAFLNDSIHEIIMDIEERGKIYGLPNIGMFENNSNLIVRGEPITSISMMPDDIHAMANIGDGQMASEMTINISFYKKRTDLPPGKQEWKCVTRIKSEQGNLSRASLVMAMMFFDMRGWFDSTEEAVSHERARDWAEKYFPGYEDDAEMLLEGIAKLSVDYNRWSDGTLTNKEGNTKMPGFHHGIFFFE
jgi:hypothetical protein